MLGAGTSAQPFKTVKDYDNWLARGNKLPQMHRLFLVDGRVLRGEIYRALNVRLADHLTTLRGTISVTNAMDERTGERYAYIVVFTENVLFIQEIMAG